MVVVSIQEAERDFASVLKHLTAGEEVVLTSDDKEIAVITPKPKQRRTRVPGGAEGKIIMSPDFDDPLPDWLLDEFEN